MIHTLKISPIILITFIVTLSIIIHPDLNLYNLIITLLLLLIFYNPAVGFILFITDGYVISSYFYMLEIEKISVLAIMTCALVICVYLMISTEKDYNFKKERNYIEYIVILLGLIMLIRTITGVGGNYAISKTFYYFLFNFLFFFIPYRFLKSEDSMIEVQKAGILISFIFLIFSLIIFFQKEYSGLRVDLSGRSNVIWFARAMGLSIIWFFYGIQISNDVLKKIGYFLLIILSLSFINLSGSRGPFISLILSFFLYTFFSKKFGIKVKLIIVLLITFVGLKSLPFIFENIGIRFTELTHDYSGLLRIYSVYKSFELFMQSPVWGWGTGSFASLVNEYIKYPHNIFAELTMELGLLGISVFITFLILVLRELFVLRKKIKNMHGMRILNIMFLFFLFGFFNSQLSGDIAHNPLMWFAAGSIFALKDIELKNE